MSDVDETADLTPATVERVDAPAAVELIAKREVVDGPLMSHQSAGCCDGSSPMCYALGQH